MKLLFICDTAVRNNTKSLLLLCLNIKNTFKIKKNVTRLLYEVYADMSWLLRSGGNSPGMTGIENSQYFGQKCKA